MSEGAQVDTPLPEPPSGLDRFKGLFGDLARPFAIIATSGSAAAATVIIALRVDGFDSAAIFIGAVYTGVAALYAGKAWENVSAGKQAATVEVAKAQNATVAAPTDGAELPIDQRVRR